jgi:epoxyqueuosine reductase
MRSTLSGGAIKAKARELGFDACGIAPAAELPELRFFGDWLDRGYAGDMTYLHRSASRRADVRRVMPEARSVIVTGTVYNVDRPYSTECADSTRAQISRYAWGDDYHDVMRARLDELTEWLEAAVGPEFEACRYVDTGPVQERVFAQYAGIGWIGKNTCVINPELGSWLFLGTIVCNLALEPDAPAFDRCGSCTLCLEACPTAALVAPHVLDATRCISYLTIERRGELSAVEQAAIGAHVYGCDICQEVCPWNQEPAPAHPSFAARAEYRATPVSDLLRFTQSDFSTLFRKSAIKRAKLEGMRRNAAALTEEEGRGMLKG